MNKKFVELLATSLDTPQCLPNNLDAPEDAATSFCVATTAPDTFRFGTARSLTGDGKLVFRKNDLKLVPPVSNSTVLFHGLKNKDYEFYYIHHHLHSCRGGGGAVTTDD